MVMSAPDDGPERDYPVYSQATKGKLPLPRPTKSSQLAAQSNTAPEAPAKEFKMKKFLNIKSKVVMGNQLERKRVAEAAAEEES